MSALHGPDFTPEDFVVSYPSGHSQFLEIRFAHASGYWFKASQETRQRKSVSDANQAYMSVLQRPVRETYETYAVTFCPGEYLERIDEDIAQLTELLTMIRSWCGFIKNDLYAKLPKIDPLQDIRSRLANDFDSMIDDPDAAFSTAEAERVDARLDQLLSELLAMSERLHLTEQQLSDLQDQFDQLKADARTYPKGVWARVTSNRLVKAIGKFVNTPEGRKLVFDQVRRAIGDDSAGSG